MYMNIGLFFILLGVLSHRIKDTNFNLYSALMAIL